MTKRGVRVTFATKSPRFPRLAKSIFNAAGPAREEANGDDAAERVGLQRRAIKTHSTTRRKIAGVKEPSAKPDVRITRAGSGLPRLSKHIQENKEKSPDDVRECQPAACHRAVFCEAESGADQLATRTGVAPALSARAGLRLRTAVREAGWEDAHTKPVTSRQLA